MKGLLKGCFVTFLMGIVLLILIGGGAEQTADLGQSIIGGEMVIVPERLEEDVGIVDKVILVDKEGVPPSQGASTIIGMAIGGVILVPLITLLKVLFGGGE